MLGAIGERIGNIHCMGIVGMYDKHCTYDCCMVIERVTIIYFSFEKCIFKT